VNRFALPSNDLRENQQNALNATRATAARINQQTHGRRTDRGTQISFDQWHPASLESNGALPCTLPGCHPAKSLFDQRGSARKKNRAPQHGTRD